MGSPLTEPVLELEEIVGQLSGPFVMPEPSVQCKVVQSSEDHSEGAWRSGREGVEDVREISASHHAKKVAIVLSRRSRLVQ